MDEFHWGLLGFVHQIPTHSKTIVPKNTPTYMYSKLRRFTTAQNHPSQSLSKQFFFSYRYDYIAVYDLLDNQVGQRYCGSIMSPVYKQVKGSVAVVVFHSDSTNSKKGFVLSYEAHTCLTSAKVEE